LKGKLWVVGIGPGGYEQMTMRAASVIDACDVIAGYTVYTDLIKERFPDKEILTTPMKQEEKRCRMAIERALAGSRVAMVCSGDAGVYGMAGLILELCEQYPPLDVEIVSGVTAALSGAAALGAPLMHDFAVISLSDLMTPWETIEKRLAACASADMGICLYNPASRKRADYLKKACEIIMKYQPAETICGFVRQIGREGEESQVMSLRELADYQADMFTTVFIGNSKTKVIGGRMVTPRGYTI
jgi:precorrin-3B C17-methyltransferase